MKIFKVVYYVFISFLLIVAVLLIASTFPIVGNFKVLTVLSGSMEPKIHTGSIVIIKPLKDYKIADIITFGPYSKIESPTTHRISDIKFVGGEPVYVTKGDANDTIDTREIKKKDILGKVILSVPYLGYFVHFVKQPFGFMLLIIVPATLIIYEEIKKVWKEILKIKKKLKA